MEDSKKLIKHISCYDGKNYRTVYIFPLDGDQTFHYRARNSFNAFFFNHKKKRFHDKKMGLRYRSIDKWEYDRYTTGKYAFLEDVPVVYAEDIYDFFEKIRYDYKKGNYTHV